MADDGQDKQHAPTERRLREAAENGQIQRAGDLPKAAVIILGTTIGLGAAAGIGYRLEDVVAIALSQAGTATSGIAMGWAGSVIAQFGPLLLLIGALAIGSSLFSGGWILSIQSLMPDLSKFNPVHGMGELVSATHLTETLKSMLKFIVIGGVGGGMIYLHGPDFAALDALNYPGGEPVVKLCLQILVAISMVILVLAGGDVGLQYWLTRRKLRMSDTEIRNEMKDAVGNPHVRQRQRALARRMAKARQMKRLPEASVVVTNPTHFAVAIRYRRGTDPAPLLLAKGGDLLAQEIVTAARGHGIPIVEAPPLARAVYRHVEPGEHVPVALYRACAEVLGYIWKMQRWRATGGKRPLPPSVQSLDIEPDGYEEGEEAPGED